MDRPALLLAFFAAALWFPGAAGGASEYHTFTGKTGKTVEARILSISDDKSTLKLEDRGGRVFESKITGLSLDDQQFIRSWLRRPGATVSSTGRLRVFGQLRDGRRIDVGKAGAIDDFVSVRAMPDGWLALRENGELVTYSGRNNGMGRVKYVGANAQWLLFVKRDGTIWGYQGRQAYADSVTTAEQAVSGAYHSAVRLKDGTVRVWGAAYGNPKVPVAPLEPLENIIDIASTQGMIAAIDGEGRVNCWNTTTTHIESRLLGGGVVDVEGSIFHFVALTRSGEVLEWTDASLQQIREPRIDLGGGKAVAVRAGGATRAARKEDGTWVAWGKDGSGIIDKINSLGPDVPDLAFFSEPGDSTMGYVVWIEP